jgi:hypothetical protein
MAWRRSIRAACQLSLAIARERTWQRFRAHCAQVWRRSSPTSDRSVPRRSSTRCSRGSGERHVAPRPNWAHPCHICTGTGLTPARSAPGMNSPLPHLHRGFVGPRPCFPSDSALLAAAHRLHGSSPLQQCAPLRPRLPPSWPCGSLPCAARDRPTLRSSCGLPTWMAL